MKFPQSFGNKSLPVRVSRVLLFTLCTTLVPGLVLANDGTKPAARPVARLLSTSRQETPARERARMVTSYRSAPSAAVAARPATRVSPTGSENRLFDLINEERRSRGRKPLLWDGDLTRMARHHSENMSRQGFFNHVDADGLDMSDRAELLGVRGWRALAENIAYNQGFDDPESFAVERWMTSAKHRENILNGEFTHAGLGVVRGSNGWVYFTQVFMKR
jgi:uncharacterized protein YkwD